MTSETKYKYPLTVITSLSATLLVALSQSVVAKEDQKYPYAGDCATLPADRTTEFHGNPERANLLLGMAGNQWVIFDQAMRDFNIHRGLDGGIPAHQNSYSLNELRTDGRKDYYIQLIPPGTIRDQIKSGCMILGNIDPNESERNFLPLSIQIEFDVFSSTNYNLMRDLANNGFVREAKPYTKNKLDLLVTQANPNNIGVPGTNATGLALTGDPDYDKIFDIVIDLLDPNIPVSQVDHINEGIHSGINAMYQRMDQYIRDNDPTAGGNYRAALDNALAAVGVPQQPSSPGYTRPIAEGITTDFNLATNSNCSYASGPYAGALRFCEYAVLNKNNTHETRVHHVETPARVRNGDSFTGPLWITEVVYAQNSPNPVAVEGVNIAAADPGEVVNAPVTYSITVLNTAKHKRLAHEFVNWIRSPDGQRAYTDGGFIGLTDAELAGGECYARDGTVSSRINNRCKYAKH